MTGYSNSASAIDLDPADDNRPPAQRRLDIDRDAEVAAQIMPILVTACLCTLYIAAATVYFASLTSGYSHTRHTISELGEIGSRYSRLVGMGVFLPVGLCCLILARCFAETVVPSDLSRGASTVAFSLAAGYIVAAVFPCDPGAPLQGSWRQAVHNLGGGAEYVGGATGLWLIGGSLRQGTLESAFGTAFVTAAGLVAVAVVALSTPALFRWRGAIQRIAELVLFAALIAVAGLLSHEASLSGAGATPSHPSPFQPVEGNLAPSTRYWSPAARTSRPSRGGVRGKGRFELQQRLDQLTQGLGGPQELTVGDGPFDDPGRRRGAGQQAADGHVGVDNGALGEPGFRA